MKPLLLLAAAEWRYWLRSHIALSAMSLFLLLLIVTSVVTAVRMEAIHHARTHHQEQAEDTFLEQPDRHPHRMVHYGHYVFRNPAPLAIFDPGLDPVTGQSIFLEGHRQNSAMFSESAASADMGGLAMLTPALLYQFFAPLLILLLGHGSLVREREARTLGPLLAQGISGTIILLGKALAIFSFILLILIPLVVSTLFALLKGESFVAIAGLFFTYLVYLTLWAWMTLIVSTQLRKRANIAAILISLWIGITLVIPAVAVNLASIQAPLQGKIEMDLVMLEDLHKVGDSHNANDPAFAILRAILLKKHDVTDIADLPMNYRGIVAMEGERRLTEVLNQYATQRMEQEAKQTTTLMHYAWLSPNLAAAHASRALSGTDLYHFHRFLNEAETIRFDFVQGLNNAHVELLSYQNDINRNKDEASRLRARVDAKNWEVLNRFEFTPSTVTERLHSASSSLVILSMWFILLCVAMFLCGRNLTP